MVTFDRGSSLIVEVNFEQNTPFGGKVAFNPTSPKITITDPSGVVKVTEADLTGVSTGKFYYTCQTATTWEAGYYSIKVTAASGSFSDITINPQGFELV